MWFVLYLADVFSSKDEFQRKSTVLACNSPYTYVIHYQVCKIHYLVCKIHYLVCKIHYLVCKLHYLVCKLHYLVCKIHELNWNFTIWVWNSLFEPWLTIYQVVVKDCEASSRSKLTYTNMCVEVYIRLKKGWARFTLFHYLVSRLQFFH